MPRFKIHTITVRNYPSTGRFEEHTFPKLNELLEAGWTLQDITVSQSNTDDAAVLIFTLTQA